MRKPFKIKHRVLLFLNLLATSKAFLQAAPILQLPNLILAQTYLSTLPNLATKNLVKSAQTEENIREPSATAS